MCLRKIIFLFCFFPLYACGDFKSGYQAGYEQSDRNQWIVFGRDDYLKGYHAGQAEQFQQDWLAENPDESDALHCPVVITKADPLMFLPAEYKEVSPGVYRK